MSKNEATLDHQLKQMWALIDRLKAISKNPKLLTGRK